MPKTHSYGASYPSGAIVAHDGEVTATPDEGNEAPRIEDESRPGGADTVPPIDETPAPGKDSDEQDQDESTPGAGAGRNDQARGARNGDVPGPGTEQPGADRSARKRVAARKRGNGSH